jgi:hypothetical protein
MSGTIVDSACVISVEGKSFKSGNELRPVYEKEGTTHRLTDISSSEAFIRGYVLCI